MVITQDIISVGAHAPIFFAPNVDEVEVDISSESNFKSKIYIGYSKPKSYKKIKDKDGLVLLDDMLIEQSHSSVILASPKYIIVSVSEVNSPIKLKLTTKQKQIEECAA